MQSRGTPRHLANSTQHTLTMNINYCYWSIGTKEHRYLLVDTIHSAREAGVYEPFHVFTDELIDLPQVDCYETNDFKTEDGIFKLIHLSEGLAKLNYDFFIWVDADHRFNSRPRNLLRLLADDPLHVPLFARIVSDPKSAQAQYSLEEMMPWVGHRQGVVHGMRQGTSAFWIIHHDAIRVVVDLVASFRENFRRFYSKCPLDLSLTYAMHMLTVEPERHRQSEAPDLWGEESGISPQNQSPKNWSACRRQDYPCVMPPSLIHLHRQQITGSTTSGRSPSKPIVPVYEG